MSPSSGNGSEDGIKETLTITSSENLTEKERSGVLSIVSADNTSLKKEITLTQEAFEFSASPDKITLASAESRDSVDVSVTCSGGGWTADFETSCDWLKLDSKDTVLTITPLTANTDTSSARTAQITVKSTLSGLTRTVAVTQPKASSSK